MAEDPDPLDALLRDLARDTEPLVVLAGPQAARRLGERRRTRRRAGVVSAAAALALAFGGWQLLPRIGSDGGATAPPAHTALPPVGTGLLDRLTAELLPPTSLPSTEKLAWQEVPSSPKDVPRLPCHEWAMTGVSAQTSRTYRVPHSPSVAYYRLYAFTDAATAAAQTATYGAQLKAQCHAPLASRTDGVAGTGADDPSATTYSYVTGDGFTIWLERHGAYVAVLVMDGQTAEGQKSGYTVDGSRPEVCISRSLDRLTSGTAAPATGAPSSGANPPGASSYPPYGTTPGAPAYGDVPGNGTGTVHHTGTGQNKATGIRTDPALPTNPC